MPDKHSVIYSLSLRVGSFYPWWSYKTGESWTCFPLKKGGTCFFNEKYCYYVNESHQLEEKMKTCTNWVQSVASSRRVQWAILGMVFTVVLDPTCSLPYTVFYTYSNNCSFLFRLFRGELLKQPNSQYIRYFGQNSLRSPNIDCLPETQLWISVPGSHPPLINTPN